MSRFTGQPRQSEQVAEAACTASELLELLWGRDQQAAPTGPVSPSQLRALLVIEQHEGANLRTLGEVLGSRASSLSRLCDRMEAMGLVVRSPSPRAAGRSNCGWAGVVTPYWTSTAPSAPARSPSCWSGWIPRTY